MTHLFRHLRGLGIAIAILALSAGVVFGARGLPLLPAATWAGLAAAGDRMAGAGDAEEETTDEDEGDDSSEADEADEADDDAEASEAPEADEDADPSEAPEAPEAGETDDAPAAGTHGAMVSEAAGMDTPAGFASHGAFVSCVARQDHGHLAPGATPIPPDQLTPADCVKGSADEETTEPAATTDRGSKREKANDAKAEKANEAKAEKAPKAKADGKGKHGR